MSAMHLKNVFSISFLSQQIRAVGTGGAIASNILADQFILLQIWGRLYPPYYYSVLPPPRGRLCPPQPPDFLDFPTSRQMHFRRIHLSVNISKNDDRENFLMHALPLCKFQQFN